MQTSNCSCIDLIFFTDQSNLSVNSSVHVSLHPNCHHQIVISSFNPNISYFFAEQYTPLKNNSVLPIDQILLTQSRLVSLDINEDKILKIIRTLNIHKVHSHDDIFIRKIKNCDKSLLKPLILLFQNSIKLSYCPYLWKRSNIKPVENREYLTLKRLGGRRSN